MPPSTVRVELPAYSHSFQIQVTPAATIRDVKQEITKVCPGSPRPEGQRLVWRGRFLKDEETVADIWKSSDGIQVIHLAVHPSAWTSSPPNIGPTEPTPSSPLPRAAPQPARPRHSHPSQLPSNSNAPPSLPSFAYMHYLHSLSLSVLSGGSVPLPTVPTVNELEIWRSAAQELYHSRAWPWPSIYDEPFPSGSPEPGATYQAVTLEGLPYLRLATPEAIPTMAQSHALQVLTHTFSILSAAYDPALYAPLPPYPPHPYTAATNVNQHLQQLGLPALRLAHNQGPNPNPGEANPLGAAGPAGQEIRAIPLRALMVPLMMLAFRTLLLLYFFSPSKRPLFGLVLSVWILYEAWNALHLVLRDGGNDRAANAAAGNAPAPAPAGQQGPAPAPAGVAGPNMPVIRPRRSSVNAFLDWVATINLHAEDLLLESGGPAPGIVQKTRMFVTLFLMSLYPAAWDRRRLELRRREGRLRTEARLREAPPPEEADANTEGQAQPTQEDVMRARAREQCIARHERRPAWVRDYVERALETEWVDDP